MAMHFNRYTCLRLSLLPASRVSNTALSSRVCFPVVFGTTHNMATTCPRSQVIQGNTLSTRWLQQGLMSSFWYWAQEGPIIFDTEVFREVLGKYRAPSLILMLSTDLSRSSGWGNARSSHESWTSAVDCSTWLLISFLVPCFGCF